MSVKCKTYHQLPPVIPKQLRPTRPPTEPVGMPKRARAAEAWSPVGTWAALPIMIHVHHHELHSELGNSKTNSTQVDWICNRFYGH